MAQHTVCAWRSFPAVRSGTWRFTVFGPIESSFPTSWVTQPSLVTLVMQSPLYVQFPVSHRAFVSLADQAFLSAVWRFRSLAVPFLLLSFPFQVVAPSTSWFLFLYIFTSLHLLGCCIAQMPLVPLIALDLTSSWPFFPRLPTSAVVVLLVKLRPG